MLLGIRLVCRNDTKIEWLPQSMYYVQNGSNFALDRLHVKQVTRQHTATCLYEAKYHWRVLGG